MSFQGYLKADTETKVPIGPVVAVGDGFTPVTGLDLTIADEAVIMKHNAAAVTGITGATCTAISGADGEYNVTMTTGYTDTEGMLKVIINDDSLCLPIRAAFMVLSANAYDALVAGTDLLDVNVTQISGDVVPNTSGKLHVLDDSGASLATAAGLAADTSTVTGLITTVDTVVDAIKAKTDNLPTDPADSSVITGLLATIDTVVDNIYTALDTEIAAIITTLGTAGAGLTAVAWNAAWDAEVQSEVNDALVVLKLDHLIAVAESDDPVDDSIIAKLAATGGDWSTFVKGTDSLQAIRDRGDAAWAAGGGGSETWVFTLTEAGSGEPVADANVWVTADEAGEGAVIISGYTSTLGVVTFYLDTGTYYYWIEKSGWNFENPFETVIAATGSSAETGIRAGVPAGALSICNEAINLLGGQTLTDFTDNTKAARLVEQFYTPAIAQTLRDYDWAFATKRSSELAVLDDEPEFEWSYQYQLPSDCVRVISMSVEADFEIEGTVLLTNMTEVYIKYIYLITDVSLFDSLFRRALVRRLAADMAYALTKKRSKEEELILLYDRAISKAKAKDRKETHNVARTPASNDSWTKNRG